MNLKWPKAVLFSLVTISLIVPLVLLRLNRNHEESIEVWGWQYSPYSSDPIEYDDIVHHMAWTSVYGTLVSSYKVGQLTPQIAKSWISNKTFTEWSFHIKQQCFFENGDPITEKVVADSIKRIALVQAKKNSKSGITEDLLEVDKLKRMSDSIAGISYSDTMITLKFSKPKENLLSQIGFGLYAVVHPSLYDENGEWADKRKIISSGPYRVTAWTDDSVVLKVNEQQSKCFELSPGAPHEIKMSFGNQNIDRHRQLIISGSSKSLMIDDSFEFLGPADSDIMYIRVYKNFQEKAQHQILRDTILGAFETLKNIRFSINRSFLPLTIHGVRQAVKEKIDGAASQGLQGLKLKVPLYKPSPKSPENHELLSYTDAFNEVMNILEKQYGVLITRVEFDATSFGDLRKRSELYDLEMLLTGVVVENPYEDVRFMFKSKEGIQLPDGDGTISPLLENVADNLPQINDKIWSQARIIPITHYSSGLWFKKGVFDVEDLNHVLPPTDFQYIKIR